MNIRNPARNSTYDSNDIIRTIKAMFNRPNPLELPPMEVPPVVTVLNDNVATTVPTPIMIRSDNPKLAVPKGIRSFGFDINVPGIGNVTVHTPSLNDDSPSNCAFTITTDAPVIEIVSGVNANPAATVTASITGTVMNVTSGTGLAINQYVTGNNIDPRTYITSLGTGLGGPGTYNVNISQTVASTTVTTSSVFSGARSNLIVDGVRINDTGILCNTARNGNNSKTMVVTFPYRKLRKITYLNGSFAFLGFIVSSRDTVLTSNAPFHMFCLADSYGGNGPFGVVTRSVDMHLQAQVGFEGCSGSWVGGTGFANGGNSTLFNANVSGNLLTVTSNILNTVPQNSWLIGAGDNIPALNTRILAYGTPVNGVPTTGTGGVGTYALNIPQNLGQAVYGAGGNRNYLSRLRNHVANGFKPDMLYTFGGLNDATLTNQAFVDVCIADYFRWCSANLPNTLHVVFGPAMPRASELPIQTGYLRVRRNILESLERTNLKYIFLDFASGSIYTSWGVIYDGTNGGTVALIDNPNAIFTGSDRVATTPVPFTSPTPGPGPGNASIYISSDGTHPWGGSTSDHNGLDSGYCYLSLCIWNAVKQALDAHTDYN